MQTTSVNTRPHHDGALFRAARAVGKWFTRTFNAIGQPARHPEADRWSDWPRFPPF